MYPSPGYRLSGPYHPQRQLEQCERYPRRLAIHLCLFETVRGRVADVRRCTAGRDGERSAGGQPQLRVGHPHHHRRLELAVGRRGRLRRRGAGLLRPRLHPTAHAPAAVLHRVRHHAGQRHQLLHPGLEPRLDRRARQVPAQRPQGEGCRPPGLLHPLHRLVSRSSRSIARARTGPR